jgi:eukaryotic-like serine/threonine-protein kinase
VRGRQGRYGLRPSQPCRPRTIRSKASGQPTCYQTGQFYLLPTGPVRRIDIGTTQHLLQAGQEVPGRPGYFLERPLGQGARHDVWLARHQRLGQSHVFKFADHGARLNGLKREYTLYRVLKQELGQRDDFATVLDSNFVSAPYFLEYEYGGVSLSEWAVQPGEDGQPRLAAMPQEERLALFLQIAKAVAAAHSVGVLHKDLKPANVLIAPTSLKATSEAPSEQQSNRPSWTARLTDFGSSRLLDPTRLEALGVTAMGLTLTQDAAGSPSLGSTPLYLAPEVVAGQPSTTQSDLYALGLMLYQMLVDDFRRTLATGWQRDIDDPLLIEDITAATEGRPQDRLSGVAEMVEMLASHEQRRADEAAHALEIKRVEAVEAAARKANARRPWVLALVASLGVGFAASLGFYAQAKSALWKAEQETVRAHAVTEFLHRDVLQSPNLQGTQNLKPISLVDVLKKASLAASERFKDQPRVEAIVRRKLGEAFLRAGSNGDANAEMTKALVLISSVATVDDVDYLTIRFSESHMNTMSQAVDEGLRGLEAAEKDAKPQRLTEVSELAYVAVRSRFESLLMRELMQEAVAVGKRMVVLADQLTGPNDPLRLEVRERQISAMSALEPPGQEAALIAEISSPPFNASVNADVLAADNLRRRAWKFDQAEKPVEAAALLVQARERMRLSSVPNILQLGHLNSEMGFFYARNDLSLKARESFAAASGYFSQALGPDHQYVHMVAIALGDIALDEGRSAEALEIFTLHEPWFNAHSSRGVYAALTFVKGLALLNLGRAKEALAVLTTLRPEFFAGNDELAARWKAAYADALAETGNLRLGVPQLRDAIAQMQAAKCDEWRLAKYKQQLARFERGGSGPRIVQSRNPLETVK